MPIQTELRLFLGYIHIYQCFVKIDNQTFQNRDFPQTDTPLCIKNMNLMRWYTCHGKMVS